MPHIVKPSIKDFVSQQQNMTLKLPDFSNLEEWDSQFHDFPGFPMTYGKPGVYFGELSTLKTSSDS